MKTTLQTALFTGLFAFHAITAFAKSSSFSPDNGLSGAPVLIYIYAVLGPHPTNVAACDSFGTNVVAKKYYTDTIDGELGWRLQTDYISQPSDLSRSNIWFVLHAISTSSNYTFTPDHFVFTETSSDVNNSLGKVETFSQTNWIFTPKAMGVRWGAGGRGFANTLVTSGSYSNQPVHEFITAGVMTKYFNTPDATTWTNLNTALDSFYDFQVMGKWQLMSNGVDVAHGHKTLHKKLDSTPGILADKANIHGIEVEIGLESNTNDSWVIEYRPALEYGDWVDTAILTGGESIIRPATGFYTGFWRSRKQ
jgi:hypothetical protein